MLCTSGVLAFIVVIAFVVLHVESVLTWWSEFSPSYGTWVRACRSCSRSAYVACTAGMHVGLGQNLSS